jgi:hypothetical protein
MLGHPSKPNAEAACPNITDKNAYSSSKRDNLQVMNILTERKCVTPSSLFALKMFLQSLHCNANYQGICKLTIKVKYSNSKSNLTVSVLPL